MNNLITLHTKTLAGNTVETVSARELHVFLGSKQDFSTWIKARIEDYDFQEEQDYLRVEPAAPQKNGAEKSTAYENWQGRIEYYITLDMAKELAMVERNAKGKEARRYFIACERQLKAQNATEPTSAVTIAATEFRALYQMLRAMELDRNAAAIGANGAIIRTSGVNLLELTGQTRLLSETQSNWYIPTELGEMLEPTVKPAKINIRLAAVGLQIKNHATGKWELTEEGQKYGRITEVTPAHGGKMRPQIVWKKDVLPLVEQPVEGE
jgi:phage anti-repressor protein